MERIRGLAVSNFVVIRRMGVILFLGGGEMTEHAEQPARIVLCDNLELVKYYPYYQRTLAWYQDPVLCRQVDNREQPYDLDKLKRMYHYLSQNGECYYIKYKEQGRWHLVGDISLCGGSLSIVICPRYQNRHIGREAISGILDRARQLGLCQVEAVIYSFNNQSRKAFEAAGFQQTGRETYRCIL